MGTDTCSCCSSQQQQRHQQQLDKASRPTYRKPNYKQLNGDYNNTDTCCCENKTETDGLCMCLRRKKTYRESEFKMEYKFIEEIRQKGKDEDTKVSEEPSFNDTPNIDESSTTPSQPPPIHKSLNRFSDVTKDECIQFLIDEMKVIVPVYVHRNIYDRWTLSHRTFTRLSICADLHIPCYDNKYDSDYKEMKCFLLKNFEKVLDIKQDEMKDFKNIILWAIELCDNIYFLNLNSSSTDAVFLAEILDVLIERDTIKAKTRQYGPEILDIENIPIEADGIRLICKYLEANVVDTKWLKIGNCFSYEISSELAENVCNSFEGNHCILKMDIGLNWNQYKQQIDKKVKQNKERYNAERRKQRKMTI